MQLYYAPSSGGFYRDGLHHDIPADAVEITADDHAALLRAQATGQQIQPDANGRPVAVTPPGPTPAELRARLLAEIGTRKNALRDGGFTVPADGAAVTWDSDAAARLAYAELAQRLTSDPAFTTRWKASAGVWVDMTAALFRTVYAAGAAHIAAAYAWQEREEARLAATPDNGLAGFVVNDPALASADTATPAPPHPQPV